MDNNKIIKEKQIDNLLQAIKLKNEGINDKSLLGVVEYVIEYEIKELALKPVIEERPTRRSLL